MPKWPGSARCKQPGKQRINSQGRSGFKCCCSAPTGEILSIHASLLVLCSVICYFRCFYSCLSLVAAVLYSLMLHYQQILLFSFSVFYLWIRVRVVVFSMHCRILFCIITVCFPFIEILNLHLLLQRFLFEIFWGIDQIRNYFLQFCAYYYSFSEVCGVCVYILIHKNAATYTVISKYCFLNISHT